LLRIFHPAMSRRTALAGILGVASSAPLLASIQLPALPELNSILERAIAAREGWQSLGSDCYDLRRCLKAARGATWRDEDSELELRASAVGDTASHNASYAWEDILAAEARIATAIAGDLQGVMIQAQILANRHIIGYLDDDVLTAGIVRNLERLQSADLAPRTVDAETKAACNAWESAILAVIKAHAALDVIQIDQWALRNPEWEADLEKRAAIVAECQRTGWDAALERLWGSQEHLVKVEERISVCVAQSHAALLTQARLLHRRLTEQDLPGGVQPYVALCLVHGLEALGCKRTRDLSL
jgi:hypothetical protein